MFAQALLESIDAIFKAILFGLIVGFALSLPHVALVWVALGRTRPIVRLMVFAIMGWLLTMGTGAFLHWDGIWFVLLYLTAPTLALLAWRYLIYEPIRFSLSQILVLTLLLAVALSALQAGWKSGQRFHIDEIWMMLQVCAACALLMIVAVWASKAPRQRIWVIPVAGLPVASVIAFLSSPHPWNGEGVFLFGVAAIGYSFSILGFATMVQSDLVTRGKDRSLHPQRTFAQPQPLEPDWIALTKSIESENSPIDSR